MAGTLREEALDHARQLITRDRNSNYGDPEDNFGIIADIARPIAQFRYGPEANVDRFDVVFHALSVKLGRLANNPTHLDSWIDLIGYAACGYEIARNHEAAKQDFDDAIDAFVDMLDAVAEQPELFPLTRVVNDDALPADVGIYVYREGSFSDFLTDLEAGEWDAS